MTKAYYESGGITLYHGDCRAVLATLPDGFAQTCVTSPPYFGLRDYGLPKSVWGGEPDHTHVWGDSIAVNATNHTDKRRWNHTRNGRDEEQPTEKRVAWLRTVVDQGNFCECGAWRGCLGLEPTPELYVEHIVAVFREVWRVLRDDATLWLNLGDSYAHSLRQSPNKSGDKQNSNQGSIRRGFGPIVPGLKEKDLIGIPWMVAFALRADGWYLRSDIIWAKPNPMPESVTDRPTKSHEYLFLLSKSERYWYDAEAIQEPAAAATYERLSQNIENQVGSDRVPGKTNGRMKAVGCGRGGGKKPSGVGHTNLAANSTDLYLERNRHSVWTVPTKPYKGAHFATFPPKLIEPCILAGCKPGGTVLDPFAGSGTTLQVAAMQGCRAMGIEASEAYCEIAAKRLAQGVLDFEQQEVAS